MESGVNDHTYHSYRPPSRVVHFGVRQFKLYLATFVRAISLTAPGHSSPVALISHLFSQQIPPTFTKPESKLETETATICLAFLPSKNHRTFFQQKFTFPPPSSAVPQSAWQMIAHPDFRRPALCLTTYNHQKSL